mgnify:CR=1 FL=1
MGERRYEQVAAQPAEQVQQIPSIGLGDGCCGLAHAVQQLQKMGIDTAWRVGANPEMCGDAFDQRRV